MICFAVAHIVFWVVTRAPQVRNALDDTQDWATPALPLEKYIGHTEKWVEAQIGKKPAMDVQWLYFKTRPSLGNKEWQSANVVYLVSRRRMLQTGYEGPKGHVPILYRISWTICIGEDPSLETATRRALVDLGGYQEVLTPQPGYPPKTRFFWKKSNRDIQMVVTDIDGSKALQLGKRLF